MLLGAFAGQICPSDVNGDGLVDVVVVTFGNEITVLLNQRVAPSVLVGDINLDGGIDLFDVSPFVPLMLNGHFQNEADTNKDGIVDLNDIQAFIKLLVELE